MLQFVNSTYPLQVVSKGPARVLLPVVLLPVVLLPAVLLPAVLLPVVLLLLGLLVQKPFLQSHPG